jgi:hypothetical protein
VFRKVVGGTHHLCHSPTPRICLVVGRRPPIYLKTAPRTAVHITDALLRFLIADDDPVPVLFERSSGRLKRDLDALLYQMSLDRALEVEASAHRPRGRQQLIGREIQLHVL